MNEERVLVTGATGFIGQSVVHALIAEGYSVRALSREYSSWPFDDHPMLERVTGDVRDMQSLEKAVAGVQYIVHLAAAKNDEKDSVAINVRGAQNISDAARIAGIRRIVNISTQSAKLEHPGQYGMTKAKGDDVLHASGQPVVTLRSSLVYGDLQSGVFGTIVKYSSLPAIPVFGSGSATFRPIHRDDLAALIVHALTAPGVAGKIYDIGGPDIRTFDQVIHDIMNARNVHRPLIHIPVWVGLLAARIFSFMPRPPITVSNVLGGAEVVSMDMSDMQRDFAGIPVRTFAQGLHNVFGSGLSAQEQEIRALLTYALSSVQRWTPSAEDIAHMKQALRAHNLPLSHLDPRVVRSVFLLGALDAITKLRHPHCLLQKKLLVAASIAECTPASAATLLSRDESMLHLIGQGLMLMIRTADKMLFGFTLLLFPSFLKRNAGTV